MVLVALTAASVLVAVGWWVYDGYAAGSQVAGVVVASGRLEGRSVRVASQTGGRITQLIVRDGDRVEVGQRIAELDRREIAAAVEGARAAVAAAEAGLVAARRRVGALEAQAELARTEEARYRRLFERDAAPRQAVDRAEAQRESLDNELRAARAAQALAAHQVDAARAQRDAAQVRLDETTIESPAAGVVTAEIAREGEMAAPGLPVVQILTTDDMKLRAFLPLEEAGRVQPRMEARVYVGADPGRFFDGTVERVASEAEFTPKDVHMPDERATLVFAVDIRIPNANGVLRDGFPADAYIRLDPEARWPEKAPW